MVRGRAPRSGTGVRMETRASYIIVGGFVVALVAGMLVLAFWLGGAEDDIDTVPYRVVFEGNVSGLKIDSNVLFRGIPVGTVTGITIDEEGAGVIATIEVQEGVPIRTDTEAVLEQQLLTGLSSIQLKGGSADAPLLTTSRRDVAEIRADQSAIEALAASAPELLENANRLLDKAQNIFSEENVGNISNIIADVEVISGAFAEQTAKIDPILDEIQSTLTSLRGSMDQLGVFAGKLSEIADAEAERIGPAVDQVQSTAATFRQLAASLNDVVEQNSRAISDFSSTGLYELTRFLTEARTLVASLQRLTERIERDPTRFFLSGSESGVQVE